MNEQSRPVNRHCVDQLADIRAKIKELKEQEKEIASEVSIQMGKYTSLGGDEWIAKQSVHSRKGSIDTAAMEADGIDIEAYRKPDTSVYSIRLDRREIMETS